MRNLNILIILVLFIMLCLHMLIVILKDSVQTEVFTIETKEKENVVFLKTHKCASTTVQNILLRFGYFKNLSFVLPPSVNYLGHPQTFKSDMIPFELSPVDNKFNIFAHHTRFNYNEIKKVMHDDAVFITILRHPVDLFESIYSFYELGAHYNVNIHNILKHPFKNIYQHQRFRNRLGVNQMSFDLGLEEESFNNTKEMLSFVMDIDKKFDLIMISEYFEASLVLMADILNWPLTNVQYLPQNVRTKGKRIKLSLKEQEAIMRINEADTYLYNFFLNKFQRKLIEYGIEKLISNVNKLLELNKRLFIKCVEGENTYGYKYTRNYYVRNNCDLICNYLSKNELEFTDEIRNIQKEHIGKIKALHNFLSNDIY